MVSQDQSPGASSISREELLLWGIFLLAGLWLFIQGVLPAAREERAQRESLNRQQRLLQETRRQHERLQLEYEGLQHDPGLIRQTLREEYHLYPPDRIRVRERPPR